MRTWTKTCQARRLDGTLVDTAALVNQVTGRRRRPGMYVPDHHQVGVRPLLDHF